MKFELNAARNNTDVNKKISWLIFLSIIFICFDNIPKYMQLSFISSGMANKLSWYPLFICGIIFLYQTHKKTIIVLEKKYFIYFSCILLSLQIFSTINGLIIYPYYDAILNGPIEQIEKLPKVHALLTNHSIFVSEQSLLKVWLISRILKTNILDYFYTFGFSFVLYIYIKQNIPHYRELLLKGMMVSLIIVTAYGIIDALYMAGNETAKNILITVNPFLHPIKSNYGWWPPLLWVNQLRSVFPEPSHMGNFAAFILPLLWFKVLQAKNKVNFNLLLILNTIFLFLLFLTKARTAVSMVLGISVLYFTFMFFIFNRKVTKRVLALILSLGIAFWSSNVFLSNVTEMANTKSITMNKLVETTDFDAYIESNLLSLGDKSKRSNGARYALILSHLKVSLEHPILGVGNGLATMYVVDKFTEEDLDNREVKMWVDNIEKEAF